jgi:hypothetical protein
LKLSKAKFKNFKDKKQKYIINNINNCDIQKNLNGINLKNMQKSDIATKISTTKYEKFLIFTTKSEYYHCLIEFIYKKNYKLSRNTPNKCILITDIVIFFKLNKYLPINTGKSWCTSSYNIAPDTRFGKSWCTINSIASSRK